MAETIFDLSGEAREKRIAELKKKMHEAAAKNQAAQREGQSGDGGGGESSQAGAGTAQPAAGTAQPQQQAAPAATAEKEAVATKPAQSAQTTEAKPRQTTSGNGAAAPAAKPAAAPAPRPAAQPQTETAKATSGPDAREMNRREFLYYAWGAALGLLTLETGVVSYFFMYPRFRAGEFGGEFFVPQAEVPEHDTNPIPYTDGKFWFVTTEEGNPKALYMVCTHLGCLYKWEDSNGRFECPCHGSKFTHDGHYIEGPAPRSLDFFETREEEGQIVVDTGSRNVGDPAAQSPARASEA